MSPTLALPPASWLDATPDGGRLRRSTGVAAACALHALAGALILHATVDTRPPVALPQTALAVRLVAADTPTPHEARPTPAPRPTPAAARPSPAQAPSPQTTPAPAEHTRGAAPPESAPSTASTGPASAAATSSTRT